MYKDLWDRFEESWPERKKETMELISTHPIKKSDLGMHGNLFGGKLLSWLDAAAGSYAMQLCDTPMMVTVSIDKCVFKKAAKENQLLKMYASAKKIGRTSITIYVEARSHNVYSGNQNLILSTDITFVRIDETGEAIPIAERVHNKIKQIK